jgi:hypothetical protein
MIISEIKALIDLWEKLGKWIVNRKKQNVPAAESIAARFVRLFETHGVHRNQIPRFFDYGLTLKDEVSLITKLSDQMLGAACTLFAVRREWLDGAESQAHPNNVFYKYPKRFIEFVEELKAANPDGEISGVLIAPEESNWKVNALLILQESIGFVGEKEIYRYHLCDCWEFGYWKARGYLTACVAIAWKRNIFVHGLFCNKASIETLSEGSTLLGWQGEGIWSVKGKKWDPEYMALTPDEFLRGLDPERNNFGIKAGLGLWLSLNVEGFMDTGLESDTRRLFQQEFGKY